MTADKNLHKTNPDPNHLLAGNTSRANQSIGTMDMLKRDRFELLSAYLDGEVTAAQRQEVEDWLSNDPESQRLYGRLLNLRQGLQTMPVPTAQQPVEQTLEQVYQRMHRRDHRRTIVWGGSAIAAIVIGAVSTVLPTRQVLQIAVIAIAFGQYFDMSTLPEEYPAQLLRFQRVNQKRPIP